MNNKDVNTTGFSIHNHIIPILPRNLSDSDLTANGSKSDLRSQRCWARDFPVIWETNPSKNKGKAISIRIIIYPFSNNSFPQHHRIIMTSPHFDIFNHWSYSCNPFSFRSLLKEMNWDIADDEAECCKLFQDFGSMIKDRVMECVSTPRRYIAKIRMNPHENISTLTFYEVVNSYRCVELIRIAFSPTPWDQVIMEIRHDLCRMVDYHSKLKAALAKVLGIVSQHQPTLLLSGNAAGNVRARRIIQSEKWRELVETLLPSKGSAYHPGVNTEDELKKKEMFLIETENDDTIVCSKNINILLKNGEEEISRKLLFTFYSQGPIKSPTFYFITITDPSDLFLYFKSVEITHSKFLDITARLNINVPRIELESKTDPMLSELPKRAREAALGFRPTEGAGGVVGVLAADFLNGTHREPDRYQGSFEIFAADECKTFLSSESSSIDSDFKSKSTNRTLKRGQRGKKNADNNSGWNEIMSEKLNSPAPIKKQEVLRTGCLKFKERVLYKTNHILSIPFKEVPREELMTKVSNQYVQLQMEIQSAQNRLDSVMESIKRKNGALRTLIEAVEIPNPDSVLEEKNLNSPMKTGSDLHFHDDDIITSEDKKVDQLKTFVGKQNNATELEYKKKTNDIRSRSIKSSLHAKKLPFYRHSSSQPNRNSIYPKDSNIPKKRISGLLPDLLQPDMMSLKI